MKVKEVQKAIFLAKHLLAKRRRFVSRLHVRLGCDRDRFNASSIASLVFAHMNLVSSLHNLDFGTVLSLSSC